MKKSPRLQRAVLYQNCRHRTAALVDARLQHRADRGRIRIRLQLAQICEQQQRFQQLVDAGLLLRRHFDKFSVAAPFRGQQSEIGKLPLHAFRLRFRLVDLVDGHDDRHIRRSGVVDRFLRLRHDAVVGRDHQHDDVGDLRAARAHPRERFVTRRIDEHHRAIVHHDLVRADVLRDAARFSRGHVRFANGVQQAGLAVIDVTHHGNHRRTRLQIFLGLFLRNFEHHFFFEGNHADDAVERFRERRRRRNVERLVDAGETRRDPAASSANPSRARRAFPPARES